MSSRDGKNQALIKTPQAFYPVLKEDHEQEAKDEDDTAKMKKILNKYQELNKLYDQCLERLASKQKA